MPVSASSTALKSYWIARSLPAIRLCLSAAGLFPCRDRVPNCADAGSQDRGVSSGQSESLVERSRQGLGTVRSAVLPSAGLATASCSSPASPRRTCAAPTTGTSGSARSPGRSTAASTSAPNSKSSPPEPGPHLLQVHHVGADRAVQQPGRRPREHEPGEHVGVELRQLLGAAGRPQLAQIPHDRQAQPKPSRLQAPRRTNGRDDRKRAAMPCLARPTSATANGTRR